MLTLLMLFVAGDKIFDGKTLNGWETVGVAPHKAVSADLALDEALRLAGVTIDAQAALAALD